MKYWAEVGEGEKEKRNWEDGRVASSWCIHEWSVAKGARKGEKVQECEVEEVTLTFGLSVHTATMAPLPAAQNIHKGEIG